VDVTLTVSIGVGAFLVGLVIGHLVARRGKALRIDWRLQIESREGRAAAR
jgi:hypothetical protein